MNISRLNRRVLPISSILSVEETQEVVALWSQHFPNVVVITSPEMGHSTLTITHGFPGVDHMDVNGLHMKSPLFTNALVSFEIAQSVDGTYHYASAYEVMWPNISSSSRQSSDMGNYVENLWKLGMEVHADHYHWKSDMLHPAIHHMGVDITPLDFSARTIVALQRLLQETERNLANPENRMELEHEMMRNAQVLADTNDLTTANARGSISIPLSDGIVNVNGNGNGVGFNIGGVRKKSL